MARVSSATTTLAILMVAAGCRHDARRAPDQVTSAAPTSAQPTATATAVAATEQDTGPAGAATPTHVDFDPKEGEAVMRSVNRLPLVDKACHERCSLAVDYDGTHWIVDVAYDRAPAPVAPLHLFSVLVEPTSLKAISIAAGPMFGFCTAPIPIEKWPRYAAQYQRYLDDKGPGPACP
jgi:hypothetical protein